MTAEAPATPAEREIRTRIAARGAISFREFMGLALYHPDGGYYTAGRATTGAAGDFSTSADVSPLFGETLSVQAAEVHERLGGGPWQIAELGPGRGLLADDLLRGLSDRAPDSYRRLERMTLVEASEPLRRRSIKRIRAAHPDLAVRGVGAIDEIDDSSIRGLVYANEMLDAVPVCALVRTEEGLAELYVVVGTNGALELAPRPIADPLGEELAGRFQLCRRVGDRAEVCPELDRIVSGIGRVLDEGAVLFVDYGHEASALAEPRHAAGTLVAYHRHRVEHDLLARPGRQDLTAHVNWSHLDVAARDHCLDAAGRVTQDRLLLALGLLDDPVFGDAGRKASSETLRQRLAAKRLIMPGEGGGRRFEVAAYVRGIGRDLSGFRPPESWSPPGP